MAAGRIAAGIGHAARRAHGLGLAGIHLGKAVHPAGRDPVRRAGVDHLRAVLAQPVDQRHGLLGRVVGQAEHDQVDLAHQAGAGGRVLALLGGDALDLEAGNVGDPAPDLEARGAGLAVDEDGGLGLGPALGLRLGGGLRRRRRFRGCLGGHGAIFPGNVNKKAALRARPCEGQTLNSAVIAPARGACVGVAPEIRVASSASSWALLWGGSACLSTAARRAGVCRRQRALASLPRASPRSSSSRPSRTSRRSSSVSACTPSTGCSGTSRTFAEMFARTPSRATSRSSSAERGALSLVTAL